MYMRYMMGMSLVTCSMIPASCVSTMDYGIRCHRQTCRRGEYCDDIEHRCSRCTSGVCRRNPVPEPCVLGCSATNRVEVPSFIPTVSPPGVAYQEEICNNGEYCNRSEDRCDPCTDLICKQHPVPNGCSDHCSTTSATQGVGIRVLDVVLIVCVCLGICIL